MIVTTQMTYESAQLINSVAEDDLKSANAMVEFANYQLADHGYMLRKNEKVKDARYRVGFFYYDKQGHTVFIDIEAMFKQGDSYYPPYLD